MTRFSVRCLVLLLVASLCFAVFTIGVSAADAPSGSVTFDGGGSTKTVLLGDSGSFAVPLSGSSSQVTALTLVSPSAGTLVVSISPCSSSFSASGSGSASSVSATYSGSTATVSVVFSSGGSAGIVVTPIYISKSSSYSFTLVSWDSGSSGGGGGGSGTSGDYSGSTSLGTSSGGYDGFNSDGTFTGSEYGISGSSQSWNIKSTYIGQLDYYVSDETGSLPAVVSIAKNLAHVSQTSWSWKVNSDGSFTYVRPNPGSWLDNIWQMNIYFYYNLANQKGWFGHINNEFATLNSRVLQILSVLANDEDVKIKDATTDHRNWITDYFEDSSGTSGKPTTDDNDAINDSMNEVADQFQSDYSASDIGSIFTVSGYDNNLWYDFWSQTVYNDVNGTGSSSRARVRARASSKSKWSDSFSYDDDSIPDMTGFGGDADG